MPWRSEQQRPAESTKDISADTKLNARSDGQAIGALELGRGRKATRLMMLKRRLRALRFKA